MIGQNLPSEEINVNGKKYYTKRVHIMLVCTQLVDSETNIPVRGANLTLKEELTKQGFEFVGLGTAGFWGKLEV
jgi:hypothetical protein